MSHLDDLPRDLRELLARSGRGKRERALALPLAEAIAREALTMGTGHRRPILEYVVKSLRHRLGVGDHPTPPNLTPDELRFVDDHVERALERLLPMARSWGARPRPARIIPNPDGYTDPDNVIPIEVAQRLRAQRTQPDDPAA